MTAERAKLPLELLAEAVEIAAGLPLVKVCGTVISISPAALKVEGLSGFAKLGDCLEISGDNGWHLAEVIRVDRDAVISKPFGDGRGLRIGTKVRLRGRLPIMPASSWKGRTLNAICEPIDGMGPLLQGHKLRECDAPPPLATERSRVTVPVRTGIKAIDIFTPLCLGQRIGIFAGSGVGKSTLLSMLAKAPGFDTIVLALVGERGREVRDFLEETLAGTDRLRTVAVVATGDESAMMRRRAAKTATAIAEHFRDAGEHVLLIFDSITRLAHAARDVALAAGEPPVARGFPPSVFAELPRLLERSGPGREGQGTITGIYSVLIDGDDHNDPVADAVRGILDGHIVLDRSIADQGRYPAINIRRSISRLAHHAWTPEQRTLASRLKVMVSSFEETHDLRMMGGYRPGTDADLDKAVDVVPALYEALRQGPADEPIADAFKDLATYLSRRIAPSPPATAAG